MHLKEELTTRGYLHQYTHDEVFDIFEAWGKKFYLWVDLSADSMTIGNFVALMMAIRLMMKWNTGYLLVWWATSTIGNPSGKDTERPILTEEELQHNQRNIHRQFDTLCQNIQNLSGKKLDYTIVNNKDFFTRMNVLDYLKEVGRHITVNRMLWKDIVRKRVTDPDKYISYAEFSYMLIMGYDFYHLYKHDEVILEIWWSDERDGIITWIELIGKKLHKTAYGITNKLIVDSNGKKFGKSEGNAIRLDPKKNHPYVCYNYFINTADADIERYLKLFTLMSCEDINTIVQEHKKEPEKRIWQQHLAYLVTQIIFWANYANHCKRIQHILYSTDDKINALHSVDNETLHSLHKATWNHHTQNQRIKLTEALVQSGLYTSHGEAKKAIKSNAISLNEQKIANIGYIIQEWDWIQNKFILLRKGKKTYSSLLYTKEKIHQ